MIRTVCPHCHEAVSFADHLGGFTLKCPSCRVPLDVPEPSATTPSLDAAPSPEITASPPPEAPALEAADSDVPLDVERRLRKVRRRRLWPWAILLGLPVVLAGLAWLSEGASIWEGALYVGLGISALITFYALKETLANIRQQGVEWVGFLLLLYLWGLVGLWYGVGKLSQRGEVHIDNYSAQDVAIEADGSPWLDAPRGANLVESLRAGGHHLTVRSRDGLVLQEMDVEVEGRKAYVLNVLGAQTYYRGRVQYGGIINFGGSPEKITEPWFEAKADFLFQDPPERISVRVPKGMPAGLTSESRTWLRRGSPLPEK